MQNTLACLREANRLAEAGRYADLVAFLDGSGAAATATRSPGLAVRLGMAYARMGRNRDGEQWIDLALRGARAQGDRALETRALTTRGAMALVRGRIDEAADRFTEALSIAEQESDHVTVGRCSNNLGIIANMRGEHANAVGAYEVAVEAFRLGDYPRGRAQATHNLSITYRDAGNLERALQCADAAAAEAAAVGDAALLAQVTAARAEIRALSGDGIPACSEAESALRMHRQLGDVIGEAEDLRIMAGALAVLGDVAAAETMLRDVEARGACRGRPLLAALASRDLAHLLAAAGRADEAGDAARRARLTFRQLGALAEARRLESLAALGMDTSEPPAVTCTPDTGIPPEGGASPGQGRRAPDPWAVEY